jgi:hypothetical protein
LEVGMIVIRFSVAAQRLFDLSHNDELFESIFCQNITDFGFVHFLNSEKTI